MNFIDSLNIIKEGNVEVNGKSYMVDGSYYVYFKTGNKLICILDGYADDYLVFYCRDIGQKIYVDKTKIEKMQQFSGYIVYD